MEEHESTRHDNQVESARDIINEISTFDPESLKRSEDFGKLYTFETIIPHAKIAIDHVSRINTESLDSLSEHTLDEIIRKCTDIRSLIDQIKTFDPKDNLQEAELQHSKLLTRATRDLKKLPHELLPIVAYTSTDINSLAHHLAEASQTKRKIEENLKQSDSILESIKGVSAETGVSSQANFYGEDASSYILFSRIWLGVSIASGLVIALLAYELLYNIEPSELDTTIPDAIIKIAGKTLIFASFTSLFVLFVKNYAASRHNYIVNRHRHNALRTYQTLVEAAADAANSDIVLTHAAQCIFSDQPTGYSKHDTAETPHIPQVVLNPGPIPNAPRP